MATTSSQMWVLFDEMIPFSALERSNRLVEDCKAMLVIGTSATVAPASNLPMIAKRKGARIIEVNLEPTELTPYVDYSCLGKATEQLGYLLELTRKLSS